ncbi:hypothetical protein MNBD_GAMMA15-1835 [hydrothermal vent metagenome]|uniref:Methanethiol oxidase n=1 Tax=hydrothermal vent metagenome TaxID=652676 RepID=A0A3B0YK76_9ZZZZ
MRTTQQQPSVPFLLLLSLALLPGISSADSDSDSENESNYEMAFEHDDDDDSDGDIDEPGCKVTKLDWDSVVDIPIVPVQEKLLYVGTINQGDEANPDMLLVIGADPDNEEEYGKLIHRLDLPNIGDEVHHFGYNADRSKIIIPGLFSSLMHIVNLSNPKEPYIESVYDDLVEDSGYRDPHTVIGLPNGNNMITMLGADTETTAPGGVIVVCGETGEYLRDFGPPANRNHAKVGPSYMYDAGFKPELNRMITTTFGWPRDIEGPINVAGFGDEISVWDLRKEKVIQRVKISPNSGALEVRWLNEHGVPIGYTNAPGTSEIWMWDDLDGDGYYKFQVAISLPAFAVPTDILLSTDDKFLYVANWVGGGGPEAGNIQQWNIEDPFQPFLVAQVDTPYAQMMRLSLDNQRLYYGNSLLSGWDDTEFPPGVTRNISYGVHKIDINHDDGGMALDIEFFVDTSSIQKKNTVGPAGPHQIFFDAAATPRGGFH